MDWIVSVGDSCLSTLAWLLGLGAGFALLVRFMPCNRGMFWWTDVRSAGTDLLYWLLIPLFLRGCRTLLLAGAIALLFGEGPIGFAAIRGLPIWQHCLAIVVVQDVLLYWIHRAFHTAPAWQFHAVHHSPAVLDWMSAARFHLVNYLLAFVVADIVVMLLGFSPIALVALAPFNVIYSSMVHANLNWTFGPFKYVFASPVFHRWHHTTQQDAINKNFASTFPILDVIFGTFYMPRDRLPEEFGNGDNEFPEDFWGQLLYPFRKLVSPQLASPGMRYSDSRGSSKPRETEEPIHSGKEAP